MRHFNAKQLHDYLGSLAVTDSAPLLLDVREQWEFDYCHIEGSVLIPMGELPAELDSFDTEMDAGIDADLDHEREIIMICHHGIRSRQMGYYMEQAGFSSITNLDGGVEQWAKDIDKTMKRY